MLLVTHQALQTGMTDTTDSLPGTDPQRAGFTVALSAVRDQIVLAAGGHRVLAQLLPEGRARSKDRFVIRAISKNNARGPAIDRTTYKATVSINILTTDPYTPNLALIERCWY